MAQCASSARFEAESIDQSAVMDFERIDDLDRHPPVERDIAREKRTGHPTGPDCLAPCLRLNGTKVTPWNHCVNRCALGTSIPTQGRIFRGYGINISDDNSIASLATRWYTCSDLSERIVAPRALQLAADRVS